ncbi:MAG: hypothetical protein Q7S57_05160 [bacterium]|nr:hypothetical protein [bacterium]
MEIVPKDSRYIPFSQQPYCCVPTSILMVMYRRGIPLIPAEELGYHLGLTVPKDATKFFWNMRTGKRPRSSFRPVAGYGTQIFERNYEPNRVFKKLGIPLSVELKNIEKFENFSEFKKYLSLLSRQDFDILMCFHHGTLANDPEKDNGHVVVLDKIYVKNNTIRFVDPTRGPKWKIVTMKKMYDAMKAYANGKTAGFWELHSTK